MRTQELIVRLKQTPMFSSVSERYLQRLAESARSRVVRPGEILFREGELAECFHLIRSGEVHAFRWAPDGEQKVFQILTEGDLIAEAVMFSAPAVYPVNAKVEKRCELYMLSRKVLLELCHELPELAMQLLSAMSSRLFDAVDRIDQLTLSSAGQRLVVYLLQQQQQQSSHWLKLPISFSILSRQLNIAPETLSRLLQKFRNQGLISGKRKTVVLLDTEGLCDLVELPRLNNWNQPAQSGGKQQGGVGCCNLF